MFVQQIHQITALLFIMFSSFIVWMSWELEYYTNLGPGPGFFPLWLGVVLGVLSLIWFVQASQQSGRPKDGTFLLIERMGTVRIASIFASLVIIGGVMGTFGYQLTMFLFLVFQLMVLGRQRLWLTLIIAILGSVGMYHVFGRYLDVNLPVSSLAILANLGL